ncbi:GNAT family N-acetyltransferase [Roseovarius sp. 2305UL8-3]|uniref:GNAT family N-acetyltransferase n=1 Tax=Roseovarius conchicola TaxID=3121636 RepID=UPI00352942EE
MSRPMVQIIHGLPKGLETKAAALYWQAFGEKLGKLMGPEARGVAFFAESLNHDAVLAAMDRDTLLGIAAFKTGGHGFSAGGMSDLFRHYGVGALWRLIPLAMLERSAPDGILQMDGICVSADARGKGVGTALLNALFAHAAEQGFTGVTLDVIDTNPRAKALYENLGFEATGVEHTSVLGPLLGFATATKMVRHLA